MLFLTFLKTSRELLSPALPAHCPQSFNGVGVSLQYQTHARKAAEAKSEQDTTIIVVKSSLVLNTSRTPHEHPFQPRHKAQASVNSVQQC